MKVYDDGIRPHGSLPTWWSIKQGVVHWFDRERELLSLRNAVGMMSEARRADTAEYHQMADALRKARNRINQLESHLAVVIAAKAKK